MKRLCLLIALGALAVAAFASTPTAQAGTRCYSHPGGGNGCVRDKQWMRVCDTDVDGHKVWIGYHTYIFPPNEYYYWLSAAAPSGGCTAWHGSNHPISEFRVCISYEGCTPFRTSSA